MNAGIKLTFELFLDGSHLVLVGLDSFLVFLFGLFIDVDLFLNLGANLLVAVDLNYARILQVIDLFLQRAHSILKTLPELCSQFLFLIQHFFVLQVEVVIFLEDGLAETFEHLALLDACVILANYGIACCQLLITLTDRLSVTL